MRFTVGLIDEEDKDLRAIRMTIKENTPSGKEEPDFISYDLSGSSETIQENLSAQVISDIVNEAICGLIVDYKILLPSTALIEGSEIFDFIHKHVPEFPVVILTNLPEACFEKDFIDADKVYEKTYFFRLEEDYSKQKTFSLFRNMKRYVDARNGLELKHSALLNEIRKTGLNADLIGSLMQTETALSNYKPLETTQIERAYDPSKIEEVIRLLREADSLLEE